MAAVAIGTPRAGGGTNSARARAASASQLRAGTDEVRSLISSARASTGTAREVYIRRLESVAISIREISGSIGDATLASAVARLPVTGPELRQESTNRVLDELGAHADRIAAQESLAAQVATSDSSRLSATLAVTLQFAALGALLVGMFFFKQLVQQDAAERRLLGRVLPGEAVDEDLASRAARLAGRADRLAERHDKVVMQALSVTQALDAYEEAQERLNLAQDELRASLHDARDEVERLKVSAMLDELTGALKYPYLVHRLRELLVDFLDRGSPFCLLELDLDNFKDVNDTFGHSAGDDALRDFARILRAACQADEIVVRKSGDEFFVLAPGYTPARALELGERIRSEVNAHTVVSTTATLDRYEFPLAVSIGVLDPASADLSVLRQVADRDLAVRELLSYVDAALYRAKHAGRNCVRSYESGMRVFDVGADELPPDLPRINRLARSRYGRLSAETRTHFDDLLGQASNLLFPKRSGTKHRP
jgi:diguanylate cyclase (GGDEF)-like protein